MPTIKKLVEVTNEQIDDVMDAAMEGIAYWCSDAQIIGTVKDEHDGEWTSQLLTKGYTIRLYDEEEEKWHKLTLNKLLKGWALMDNMDIEQYDMNDADKVVQYALFGEQVYA